jgi:hypothetical protein
VPRYGDQKSSGIDFFIQHRWKNLTQMLGYSWSKSDERYDGFNQGEYFRRLMTSAIVFSTPV